MIVIRSNMDMIRNSLIGQLVIFVKGKILDIALTLNVIDSLS